jgi:6-phosphogluconolactonase
MLCPPAAGERCDMETDERRSDTNADPSEAPPPGGAARPEDGPAPPWKPHPARVLRFREHGALFDAAARRWLDAARRAVDQHGRFVVVLAGGSTPRGLHAVLTASPYREQLPWDKTFFVFGDERCVPPDDAASNYRMARETLFEPLGIEPWRVLRIKGERPPAEAARLYEQRLDDLFLGGPKRQFDLTLLGVGTDGHTASLFPGTAALLEESRWVVANEVPQQRAWRITLTLPALGASRRVLFLATGAEKATVLAEAFGGLAHAEPHPCERVLPRGGTREVLLDEAAAARLREADADAAPAPASDR